MERDIELKLYMEDSLFDEAADIFVRIGIDMPTAVRMFIIQSVQKNGLPFQPAIAEPEYPLWLLESAKQMEEGRVVVKTLEELRELRGEGSGE